MKALRIVAAVVVMLAWFPIAPARADEGTVTVQRPPAVELVLDVSGSMSDRDSAGVVKIEGARSAVLDYIQGAEPTSDLGLLTYPSGKSDCGSGQQVVPLGRVDGASMSAVVRTLTPGGGTPTGEALLNAKAQLDLAGRPGGSILLISDGHSTCPQDPCEVAKQLHTAGNAVQIDTVGFRVDETGAEQLRCIADAGGGRYIGVDDVATLQTQVASLSRPFLKLELDPANQTVVPDAGQGPEGLARITVHVTNDSDIEARNAQLLLRVLATPDDLAGVAPAFYQPLNQLVGNLSPHASATAQWSFRPGLSATVSDDGGTTPRKITFQIVGRADNTIGAARAPGSVTIAQLAGKSDAGPLLKNATGIAILGDSYSAGEGTGDYLANQDDDPKNLCHRSARTYLLPLMNLDGSYNLACSGAVTEQISSPNPDRSVTADHRDLPSQVDQLAKLAEGKRIDAAFMTMGGNDVGFRDIIESCLIREHCDKDIGLAFGREPSQTFLDDRFFGLGTRLAGGYDLITRALNSQKARKLRGNKLAPLVVLAYPRILPGADQGGCLTLATLGQGEIDFGNQLITRLNDMVRGTVEASRAQGIPVWFVSNTEDAFLPNHSVCDRDSYARGLTELRSNDLALKDRLAVYAARAVGGNLLAIYAEFQVEKKRIQELFHPKIEGYTAMSLAVVRWSRTGDGMAAASVPAAMSPKKDLPVEVAHPQVALAFNAPKQSVPRAATISISVDGLRPYSTVFLSLHSDPVPLTSAVVGGDGRARLHAALPREVVGDHALVVAGHQVDDSLMLHELPLRVGHRPRHSVPWIALVIGLVLAGGCVLARRVIGAA